MPSIKESSNQSPDTKWHLEHIYIFDHWATDNKLMKSKEKALKVLTVKRIA